MFSAINGTLSLNFRLSASLLSPLLIRFHSNLATATTSVFSSSSTTQKPITKIDLQALISQNYTHGKFHNLLQSVISKPNVLLAACANLHPSPTFDSDSFLYDSVSKRFSIEEISHQLSQNRFDVEVGSVPLSHSTSRTRKGATLVLPNLKLKVVIEAVRMVLELIYDARFATFAYGSRVGMGRHTAIRYLKTTVQNPNWWFTVKFLPDVFNMQHFDKLSSIIEQKIDDRSLINLLKRFFESEAVGIELGSCFMGRGFPQESSLCGILVNIYLSDFDKEIQNIRNEVDIKNVRFDSNELSARVVHKPVKVYAVRYLDEILIITSGSKLLTVDLKNRVVKFLEEDLELKVDKLNTAIHSAVSEKIGFIGMELRAVTPSFLHPPLTEKAMRARKKYIKQKEGLALEMKNARETNRKKLGLKILDHLFKKLKRGDEFKLEFQIEKQVRDIFKSWADGVVQEFFTSYEERYNWHRKLSSGDFLSLRAIRDQLPSELVEAYDRLQVQVDKHLTPVKARKTLEEEDRKVEEVEHRNYAESTVEDLTKLCMRVAAPEELVRKAVRLAGFTNSMGRPRPIELLIRLEDADIIKWYAGVGKRWLDFFCCCRNFKMVKTVVTYHLRFSCILTLAEKHESTKHEAIRHYSKDLKVYDTKGVEEVNFPTEREIKMMGDKNLSDPKPVDGTLTMTLVRLASDELSGSCMAHFCDKMDTTLYRIHLLQKRLKIDPVNEEKWVPGMGAIHESLNRKCVSLCSSHINDLYMGYISLQDIDCTSLMDVL